MTIPHRRKISVMLAITLVLAIALEMGRSEAVMRMSKYGLASAHSAALETRDALTGEQVAALDRWKWYVVANEEETGNWKIAQNAVTVLEYMKQDYETVSAKTFEFPESRNTAVLLSVFDLSSFPNHESVVSYIESGGRVFFLRMPETSDEFYNIYRSLGIVDIAGYVENDGLKLVSDLIPNLNGETFEFEGLRDTFRIVRLDENSNVLLENPEGIPVMWETEQGSGKAIVYAGVNLQDKMNRGILAGGISKLVPDFAYPVINAKLMYLDDFPAPVPEGYHDRVFSDFRRNIPSFYKQIWWPDMIRLARTHNLTYTAAFIQSYNDRVDPPFADPPDENLKTLVMFGREILKGGGEISLHGYNHQSLATNPEVSRHYGYNVWKSKEDMAEATRTALAYLQKGFSHYKPVSYVPPSNALDESGRAALLAAWPELQTINSVYTGDASIAYTQEFEVSPDGIAEMPRVTSGYVDDDEERWLMAGAVATVGVFSHFVHPDDVLSDDRNFGGKGWEELLGNLERFLHFVDEKYGWLRPMSASEASLELRKWAASKPYLVQEEDGIKGYINGFSGDLYFILRTDRKIGRLENCEVERIDEGVFLVRADQETFSIGLGRTS